MKKHVPWLSCLVLAATALIYFAQAGEPQPAGKHHYKAPAHNKTSTVTVLNPALFHRLNTILENGLIQGE